MKVALEYLYHFCCDVCGRWWSQADIEPIPGEKLYCPACGHANRIEAIETFREAARNSCLRQIPDGCGSRQEVNSAPQSPHRPGPT